MAVPTNLRHNLNLLVLEGVPILEQLQLEEALLRSDQDSWCLVNTRAAPAIVMGVSTIPETVIDPTVYQKKPLPLIRRFSGGGTVVIEPATVFMTLILDHSLIPVLPYPREVMEWTHQLYQPAFTSLPFKLEENDYTLAERKCGGNAQYFTKNRLLHHTSFLWDYTPAHMEYLCMPPRMPSYRNLREHSDFLTKIKEHIPEQGELVKRLVDAVGGAFNLNRVALEDALAYLDRPHRKATTTIDWTINVPVPACVPVPDC